MYLKNIKIKDFRNHLSFERQFSDQVVILVGPNTAGKTNLIEAIRFLSLFKSFRTTTARDMIRWGQEMSRVEGDIDNGQVVKKILGVLVKKKESFSIKREVKVNGAKLSTRKAVGNFLSVLFSPDDIQLISSGPSKRRHYLDTVLGQLSRSYYNSLLGYNRALDQRNAILSGQVQAGDVDIWDDQLAGEGSRLIKERSTFLEELNNIIPRLYKDLAGEGDLRITYQPRLFESGLQVLLSKDKIKQIIISSLQKSRNRDFRYKTTSAGPHRDDFIFLLNNRDITNYGSRGEWRSTVLALKIGEKEYINKITGTKPILLLDDVFSELDSDRRQALASQIKKTQVFISTTEIESISEDIRKRADIIRFKK